MRKIRKISYFTLSVFTKIFFFMQCTIPTKLERKWNDLRMIWYGAAIICMRGYIFNIGWKLDNRHIKKTLKIRSLFWCKFFNFESGAWYSFKKDPFALLERSWIASTSASLSRAAWNFLGRLALSSRQGGFHRGRLDQY